MLLLPLALPMRAFADDAADQIRRMQEQAAQLGEPTPEQNAEFQEALKRAAEHEAATQAQPTQAERNKAYCASKGIHGDNLSANCEPLEGRYDGLSTEEKRSAVERDDRAKLTEMLSGPQRAAPSADRTDANIATLCKGDETCVATQREMVLRGAGASPFVDGTPLRDHERLDQCWGEHAPDHDAVVSCINGQ